MDIDCDILHLSNAYKILFDENFSPIQICRLLYDENGVANDYLLIDTNPSHLSYIGLKKEDVINKKATELYPQIKEEFFIRCSEAIATGKPEKFEYFHDASHLWFDVIVIPLGYQNLFGVIHTDISENKYNKKIIKANEKKDNYLKRLSKILLMNLDEESLIDSTVYLLAESFGASQAFINILNSDTILVCKGVNSETKSDFKKIYTTNNFLEEFNLLRKCKTIVYHDVLDYTDFSIKYQNYLFSQGVRASIQVPIISNGVYVASLGIASKEPHVWDDIDVKLIEDTAFHTKVAIEHIRADKAMRESESRYRNLFKTSNDGFWWMDKYGYIVEVNEETSKILNYRPDEIIGRSWKCLFDEEWIQQELQDSTFPLKGVPQRYITKIKQKDGNSIWAKCSWTDILDDSNENLGSLFAFTDITEQKRVEENLRKSEQNSLELISELERKDRNKNEFISKLSHELRNPIATIKGGISLLELKNKNTESLSTIKILQRQINHLTMLVDDCLDITRISHGKVKILKRFTNLTNIINNIIIDNRPQLIEKSINLVENFSSEPIFLNADELRITQCVSNVMRNAIKYTPDNGTITVTLKVEDKTAIVIIQDNGIGISPHALNSIFNPYIQDTQSPYTKHNKGLGLGLSLVKEFIELHGGRVFADSLGLGKGSIFTLQIPL